MKKPQKAKGSARSTLLQELAKQSNVKFLSEKTSKKILANTEFNGCIARSADTATDVSHCCGADVTYMEVGADDNGITIWGLCCKACYNEA